MLSFEPNADCEILTKAGLIDYCYVTMSSSSQYIFPVSDPAKVVVAGAEAVTELLVSMLILRSQFKSFDFLLNMAFVFFYHE